MDPRFMAEASHPAFKEAGWEYYDGAPTVDRLEETIRNLISSCPIDEREWTYSETGRIRVQREVYEEEGVDPYIEWGIYLRLN